MNRLQITRTERVLDAACGSRNLTIPAARTGADVTGLDLIPELLDAASRWAEREQLSIQLDEGNAEALPYPDGHFDVVLSMFGVMFAARPDKVMEELARVIRPGGRVALANWTRTGFIGQLLSAHVRYVAPPPDLPSPILWGDLSVIRERFDVRQWTVATREVTLTFKYPHTPLGVAELFRGTYGPTVRTFEALDEDRRALLAAELNEHWVRHHRLTPNGAEIDSTYLEVVATRR